MTQNPTPQPRLAYLTGEYPAVSHTFILREVEALRRLGAFVQTCSIRSTAPEHHRGNEEKQAAATTFYVIKAAKSPKTFISAQIAALRNPKRYFSTLKLALKTRPVGAKALLWQLFYFAEAAVLSQKLLSDKITHLHNHFGDSSASVDIWAVWHPV